MLKVYQAEVDYGAQGVRTETLICPSFEALELHLQERQARLIDAHVKWETTLRRALRNGFNAREMAQVYRSLGRRTDQGARLDDAFRQAASFVTDPLLKISLEDARGAIASGLRPDEAMRAAGLPEEDVALVRAMQDAGGVSDAFMGLGDSYEQRSKLRGKIMSVVLQPTVYTTIGLVMIWAAFLFLIPRFAEFFNSSGLKPPQFIQSIYRFDEWVVQHKLLCSVVYWAGFGALAWFVGFSRYMRRVWRAAPILRDLLARSSAAQSLSAFALLYESAMRRSLAAQRVAESCDDPALASAFTRMAEEMDAGASPGEASRRAEFPDFVAPTVIGAMDANDPDATVQDLRIFSRMLAEDVEVLSKRMETAATVLFLFMTGAMVFGVFMLTIFPELAVVLSNA